MLGYKGIIFVVTSGVIRRYAVGRSYLLARSWDLFDCACRVLTLCFITPAKTVRAKVYDGSAKAWQRVLVDAVSVRWVDLETRLVLRHVVRVLEADDRDEPDGTPGATTGVVIEPLDDTDGESGVGVGVSVGGEGEEKEGKPVVSSAAATVEIDLSEVRWAEASALGRRPSDALAKKLAGERQYTCSLHLFPPSLPPFSLSPPCRKNLGSALARNISERVAHSRMSDRRELTEVRSYALFEGGTRLHTESELGSIKCCRENIQT